MRYVTRLLATLASAMGISGAANSAQPLKGQSPVMELRARALQMNASDIGLGKDRYPGGVWAVVMDSSQAGGGAYTLMVLGDGTTSIYFDNGGGIIGAGEHA